MILVTFFFYRLHYIHITDIPVFADLAIGHGFFYGASWLVEVQAIVELAVS
jgi:hypothetical protein